MYTCMCRRPFGHFIDSMMQRQELGQRRQTAQNHSMIQRQELGQRRQTAQNQEKHKERKTHS
jgi:hypothetical protein